MAEKKSEVRIPEEHLHLNGKREHHLPVVDHLETRPIGLGNPNDAPLYLL